jgi:hypothetical protein
VGGASDDYIVGGGGTDSISGGAGNDYLVGGTGGNNTFTGGTGNDTFVVQSTADTIAENQNEGNDTVLSAVTYTLPANVENLTLQGSGNVNGTGNSLANVLIGNSGNNTLAGMGGSDVIDGGAGIDTAGFSKTIDKYVFAFTTDGKLRVIDTEVSAASGTTTITNVEFLTFSGGVTVNVNGAGADSSAANASLPTIRLVGATNANYSTIGAAVTADSSIVADIIVIAPGVYTEELAISKSLSMYGTQGYVNAPASYANTNNGTVLRAADADPAISVTGAANVPVYGLSIVSSAAATGTGVSLNGASVNVDFKNSQISGFATGILAANGAATSSTFANGVLTSNTLSINNTGAGTFIAGGDAATVRNWWGQTASPVAAVSANVTYDAWIGKGDTTVVSVTESTSLIAVQAINAAGFGTNVVAATNLTGVTAPANTTTTITATGGRKRFSGGSAALNLAVNANMTLAGSPIQLDMTTFDGSSYGNVSDPTIQLGTNASLTFSTTVDIFATSAAGAWSAFEFLAGSGQSVSVTGGNTVSIVIPSGSQDLFIKNLGTFYSDAVWKLYNTDGSIKVTNTKAACEAAARPNVDAAYNNYCVECQPSYTTGIKKTFYIPVKPVKLSSTASIQGMGTVVGVAFNGVNFDPPAPTSAILGAHTLAPMDDNGGHVNTMAGYHYHAATGKTKKITQADGHAAMIGYAMDGYGLYERLSASGTEYTDLDASRGHYDATRGYHYHVAAAGTNSFINSFRGAHGSYVITL